MRIDAHHHLWHLQEVDYPWLNAIGEPRFFGDPTSIQRNYLLDEFSADSAANGFSASVHIQVGAADPWREAKWVNEIVSSNPQWPMVQVAFCDLTAPDRESKLDQLQTLSSVRGVRQIVGRAPGEDAASGTNKLLNSRAFSDGLRSLAERDLSFDLQLLPELMESSADVLGQVPELPVALCHAGSPYDRSPQGIMRWQHQLSALSNLPHVYCKFSGLGMFDHDWQTDSFAPFVDTCLDQFGVERCMFGSNFPVDSLTSSYQKLIAAYHQLIPEAHHDQCFGATAAHFYRFPG